MYRTFVSYSFICFIIASNFSSTAFSRDANTKDLQSKGLLQVSYDECVQIESNLGQLFYVNVDGYRSRNSEAIDPAYFAMVRDLQIGGVLPHFGQHDLKKEREATQILKESTSNPLLIGVDYEETNLDGKQDFKRFGLGYGRGYFSGIANSDTQCLKDLGFISAVFHKIVGLNQALGPTIEKNPRSEFLNGPDTDKIAERAKIFVQEFRDLGVATTMKHFPYTPDDYNLHSKSEDTKLPLTEVNDRLKIYGQLSENNDFTMSTHLFNSNVDPNDMATFSKTWVNKLRKEEHFNGILMTDALFMFRNYDDTVKQMSSRWPGHEDTETIFAARAILAGHDMVFLEGTAHDTYRIFYNLQKIACSKSENAAALRKRIFESSEKIKAYKRTNSNALNYQFPTSSSMMFLLSQIEEGNPCSHPLKIKTLRYLVSKLDVPALSSDHTGPAVPTGTVKK